MCTYILFFGTRNTGAWIWPINYRFRHSLLTYKFRHKYKVCTWINILIKCNLKLEDVEFAFSWWFLLLVAINGQSITVDAWISCVRSEIGESIVQHLDLVPNLVILNRSFISYFSPGAYFRELKPRDNLSSRGGWAMPELILPPDKNGCRCLECTHTIPSNGYELCALERWKFKKVNHTGGVGLIKKHNWASTLISQL